MAHGGEAYQISAASHHCRWGVGNLPLGTYKFRWVLNQGATDDTVQIQVRDEDTATNLYSLNVNPGMSSPYTKYETELTLTNASNNIIMRINGNNTAIYNLDSFEYEKVRPDPVLFLDGDDVRVQAIITGTPTDAGDRVNIAVW
jgi:hypothetical protein